MQWKQEKRIQEEAGGKKVENARKLKDTVMESSLWPWSNSSGFVLETTM